MKKFFKAFFTIVFLAALAAGAGLTYLTLNEYNPADVEDVNVYGSTTKPVAPGDTISVFTYNIGYGADDANHDFFMDGGKTVTTESSENITANVEGIIDTIYAANADVNFLQEVDTNSKRSYNIDEANLIATAFPEFNSAYATNFQTKYIPYPFTDHIGMVNAGIQTISRLYTDSTAKRIALPVAFSWPVRTCQMKRCLLVERVPLTDSQKELVLINLHLEAYDSSGEGKAAQYKKLVEVMKKEFSKGNYVIAGGDFNSVLPSVDTSKYPLKNTEYFEPAVISTSMLTGGWKYCTDDSVPSSRLLNEPFDPESENTQYYVIDGFICSPNTIVDTVMTIDTQFKYSDHNPVMAKVTLVK
ncbi:MAG: endonuclease [Clostridia bacterium]|nr:endonuclease [Clostridia bacterium]